MEKPIGYRPMTCAECRDGKGLDFDFSMAFQPIYDMQKKQVFAYEALARGPEGQGAGWVFAQIHDHNRYAFDQACRVKAIRLAAQLNMPCLLSINFLPNAIYKPELCIRTTLEAADTYGFPIQQIIFEITEGEKVEDAPHLQGIVRHYQERGFLTALDDFGAGYSGLNLLAEMQTDLIKLDMALVRNIQDSKSRQAIVKGILQVCRDLDAKVIAEGIETQAELDTLLNFGVQLYQGYYLARPAFEALPEVRLA